MNKMNPEDMKIVIQYPEISVFTRALARAGFMRIGMGQTTRVKGIFKSRPNEMTVVWWANAKNKDDTKMWYRDTVPYERMPGERQ